MAKKLPPPDNTAAARTPSNVADMPVRQRLLLLRLNHRRTAEESKRLQGRVSEARTEFVNTLKAPVPDDGEEAKARLRQLQTLDEQTKSAKDRKSSFKQAAKTTHHALLYSEVTDSGQLMLPGATLELDAAQLGELKMAVADVRVQDEAAAASEESTPRFPAEDEGTLDELEAMLSGFIESAGINASSLGAAPAAPAADAPKTESKPRGKLAAVPAAPVH